MRQNVHLLTIIIIEYLILLSNTAAGASPLYFPENSDQYSDSVIINITHSDNSQIRLTFDFRRIKLNQIGHLRGYEIEVPGEGHTGLVGVPSVPKISRLIAIPADAKVRLSFETDEPLVKPDITILPNMNSPLDELPFDTEIIPDESVYSQDRLFPQKIVEIGSPAILRDIRVVRLTVTPIQYNPVARTMIFHQHFDITLDFESGGEVNTLNHSRKKVSKSLRKIYSSKIMNYHELDFETDEQMGSLLIIAPDNPTILNMLSTLVEWKNRRGFTTVLADLSVTGYSASEIKAFIQEAYDTWDPPLEYLILVGDCAGGISVPPSNVYGDHDYQRLAGDDILADISAGRYSCSTSSELMTEISKIIEYESNPYMSETAWYKKGAVVAEHPSSGLSSKLTKQGIKYKALNYGYNAIDTLFYDMGGSMISFTSNTINSGIGFYNFRGFVDMGGWGNGNINNLTNAHKLPFVVSITCETGNITGSDSEVVEEFFRIGTPSVPTGAIGAIGTATAATHTKHNNCVDNGIFAAFFDYDIFAMGDALNVGKLDLYLSYPDNPMSVADFSNWNNLIGDPSCQLWTDIPQIMETQYPDSIPVGISSLEFSIIDSASGLPLGEANVCIHGNGIHFNQITDENGEVLFTLPPMESGDILITCTKHNYKPHLGEITIANEDVFVNWLDIEIDDDNSGFSSGNNNRNINPGETIELGLSLHNFGSSVTTENISTLFSSTSQQMTLIDSTENFPDISPGETSAIISGFVFSVSQDAVNDYEIPFELYIESDQGHWNNYLPLTVKAPDIVYQNHEILDVNNQLDPGDISEITVSLMNIGDEDCGDVYAQLACSHEQVEILENTSFFGNMLIDQSSTGTPFKLSTDPDIFNGLSVNFELYISGFNSFTDTTMFEITIGNRESYDPTGPDDYAYYALDNSDIYYIDYPVYDWIEIDPHVPGSQYPGIDLGLTDFGDEQDDTELINLPFDFTYYGLTYSQLSICSNGWIAFGNMAYFLNFRNWYIPSTMGPYAMAAPFWDDLILQVSPPLKVYVYYDDTNHKIIIEWNVLNRAPGNVPEVFEVILYDPDHYPTETGDGIIVYQYKEIYNIFGWWSDNHFATIGIEDHNSLVGLEYSYWNHYTPGSAVIGDSTAIKFTTNQPIHDRQLVENLSVSILGNNIRLDWADIPGADSYSIYRDIQPIFNIVGLDPVSVTDESEYTDYGAAYQDKYYYRVAWDDGY